MPLSPNENLAERPHILVIDDDERIRGLVSRFLNDNGFLAATAKDAAEGQAILDDFEFDAVIVDVMMPGQTGLEWTQAMRAAGNDLPVLLLTALGEGGDRIAGLESGADDYLAKPFEPRELVLRLRSLLRRVPKKADQEADLVIGPWTYDPAMNALVSTRETQRLTAVEGNLLKALAKCAGQVIGREDLARLCELDAAGERTIDVQVTRLRRKLEEDSRWPRYLQTVRGKGYMLRVVPE